MNLQRGRPSQVHFHVTAKDANTDGELHDIPVAETPEKALEVFIASLPIGWEGSISVDDHETLHPSEMPLIETWLSP
jgi:hypothetical protein